MIIQDLLDRMSLYDNQLDLIVGGDDVARGIIAINLVQDWWEVVAARYADLCQTASTLVTVANTETTVWPTTLLRIDDLWVLDSAGAQLRRLDPIDSVGGHMPDSPWPYYLLSAGTTLGSPWGYYAKGQGGLIYWDPKPDAVYTIRGYGLWAQDDYANAAAIWLYPDSVALVAVPHAVQVMRSGLDRDINAVKSAADAAFISVARALGHQVHVDAASRVYSEYHDT